MSEDQHAEIKSPTTIAKALCYICLHQAKLENASVLNKVDFLAALGLDAAEAARVAGSSAASVAELRRRAKGRKASGKKKTKSRR